MKSLGILILFLFHGQGGCRTNVSGTLTFPAYATAIPHIKIEGIKLDAIFPPCDPDPTQHNSCSKYVYSEVDGAFDFGLIQSGLRYALVIQAEGMEDVRQYFYVPPPPPPCFPTFIHLDVLLHPAVKASAVAEDTVGIEDLARKTPVPAVKAFEKSMEKESKTDPKEMSGALLGILKTAPDYYEANLELGLEYRKADQQENAMRALTHALEVNSGSMLGRAALGQYRFEAGDFQAAADLLGEAARLGSKSPDVYYMLGSSYYKLGQLAMAEASLIRALDIAPSIGKAYLQLYNVYMRAQMSEKALQAAETYLEKYPKAADREYVQSLADKLRKSLKP